MNYNHKKEFDKYFGKAEIESDIELEYLIFFMKQEFKSLNPSEWSWGFVQTLNTNDCCDETENETNKNDYNSIYLYDYKQEFEKKFNKILDNEMGGVEEIRIYRCDNCKHIFITEA